MSNAIRTKLSSAQAISLSSMDAGDSIQITTSKDFNEFTAKFKNFTKIAPIKISKNFKGKLRPYQKEGVYWLNFLYEFGFGGILADEMGLGKTVQTLAFLQHLKDQGNNSPVLIVVPTSIITNWLYEARKFTPNLSVLVMHGPERKSLFRDISDYDIVITSYTLLRIDKQRLSQHDYSYVILDEAQNIKNEQAATTKAAKSLSSDRYVALTGTPTENRPLELWSIMDFLMPGYLGSKEFFKKHFEKPILNAESGNEVAGFLRSRVRPFILKRKKIEVEKDLPPKLETTIHVEMTQSQRALYNEMLDEVRPRVFDEIKEKGVGGASVCILAALLRLRQVCNHPRSLEAFKELEDFTSGKLNVLQDLVTEALESGRKILLYSQFLGMLALIRNWLEETKVNHLYLDGSTKNRQDLVDQFNADDDIRLFLISLKAGGTGLNLTGADTVIIYDPWWNPAVEDQAADRAHRIGQTKAVNVYRLVTEHSVESHIMELKERKSKIVDALLDTKGISPLKLSREDIEKLFAYEI
ncbi:MAG: DEAD/DEAH box helicase [Deltaproteobacteria bacterium]|nr:DEAD/DEAH box helicase [Deltaproteobacteria bacterium]